MRNDLKRQIKTLFASLPKTVQDATKEKVSELLARSITSYEKLYSVVESQEVDIKVRTTAVWLLGMLGNKRAVKTLIKAFSDGDKNLQWEAAVALGALKSKRAVLTLLRELLESVDDQKRAAAAYALGQIKDDRAVDSLLAVLNNGKNADLVRDYAAEALSNFKSEKIVNNLIKALNSPQEKIRFSCVYALSQIADKKSIRALIKLVENKEIRLSKRIRQAALEAISRANAS